MAAIKLTLDQEYQLACFIKENYALSKMTDNQFADYANSELQMNINKGHIATRRYAFNIPSNIPPRYVKNNVPVSTLEDRVTYLEKQVENIINLLDKL